MVCVGLTTPSSYWSTFIGSVTVLALLTAVLASILQRGHSRAFAIGFAVFGVGYLLWLHRVDGYSPVLLSRRAGDDLFKVMHKDEWDSAFSSLRQPQLIQRVAARRERFVEILQSGSILVVAVLGGFVGRYLVLRTDRQTTSDGSS
jgi:hypothetical protein